MTGVLRVPSIVTSGNGFGGCPPASVRICLAMYLVIISRVEVGRYTFFVLQSHSCRRVSAGRDLGAKWQGNEMAVTVELNLLLFTFVAVGMIVSSIALGQRVLNGSLR